MCRLSFLNIGAPVDAIAQFRNHVDIFKNKVGHSELAFEHSAWMSKQYVSFLEEIFYFSVSSLRVLFFVFLK